MKPRRHLLPLLPVPSAVHLQLQMLIVARSTPTPSQILVSSIAIALPPTRPPLLPEQPHHQPRLHSVGENLSPVCPSSVMKTERQSSVPQQQTAGLIATAPPLTAACISSATPSFVAVCVQCGPVSVPTTTDRKVTIDSSV